MYLFKFLSWCLFRASRNQILTSTKPINRSELLTGKGDYFIADRYRRAVREDIDLPELGYPEYLATLRHSKLNF